MKINYILVCLFLGLAEASKSSQERVLVSFLAQDNEIQTPDDITHKDAFVQTQIDGFIQQIEDTEIGGTVESTQKEGSEFLQQVEDTDIGGTVDSTEKEGAWFIQQIDDTDIGGSVDATEKEGVFIQQENVIITPLWY